MSLPMKSSPTTSDPRFQLSSVAFFGRTMAEYLQMLALDPTAMRGLAILDVASGPGSFVAESLGLGGNQVLVARRDTKSCVHVSAPVAL
jgi:hypothetical protein